MIEPKAASHAESTGYLCREVGYARASNPYLEHRRSPSLDDPIVGEFIAAWWRGWDRADAMFKTKDK